MQVKEGLKVKEGNKVYQDEINSLSKQIEQIQIQRQEVEQRLHLQLRDKDDQIQNLTKALETANSQVPVNLKLKEENDAFQQEKIEKEIIRAQLQMELEHSQAEKRRIEERLIDKDHQIKELETKVEAANDKVKTRFTQLHSVQSDNSWNFQREEVVIKEEIGRGASGLVSKGQFCGQTIAVKQIHRNILTQKHVMDEFKREVRIMASVQHPNLVRFVGAVFDQSVENFTDTPLLLLELLHTNLRQGYERFDISPGVSVSIFRDVAYGLHYLHEHQEPIIHRDVSAPNVLLEALPGGMWRAKLSDFGSANFLKRSLTLGTGAIVYTAPEMFPREDPSAPVPCPTTKCDVFSYGIVLVEVITKTMPSLENRHELFAQVQRKWQMMYDLISQCTQRQPLNRPTMLTVLNTLNMIPVARPR